jgi:prepilin-type N-terminal cleavage/methylation domain-containing protein
MQNRTRGSGWLLRFQHGSTLVELMVVVVLIGILAAVAIPVVTSYGRRSRLSEAVANIQGILVAEQALYSRFQAYSNNLLPCPPPATPTGDSVQWPSDPDASSCGAGWIQLGWKPDGPVLFKYSVFTSSDPSCAPAAVGCPPCAAACCATGITPSSACPSGPPQQCCCPNHTDGMASQNAALGAVPGGMNTFAVNWSELQSTDCCGTPYSQSWVAVQAFGDTDGDGKPIYLRGNSFNQKTFRYAIPPNDPESTW